MSGFLTKQGDDASHWLTAVSLLLEVQAEGSMKSGKSEEAEASDFCQSTAQKRQALSEMVKADVLGFDEIKLMEVALRACISATDDPSKDLSRLACESINSASGLNVRLCVNPELLFASACKLQGGPK